MILNTRRTLIVMAILAGTVVPGAAQTPASPPASTVVDVVGRWDVTFSTQQGPIDGYLTFKKDGGKIVGTVGSQQGEAATEAEVKGKDLTIWFTYPSQNGPLAIEMTGTVDGDAAKGSFTMGGSPGGTWEGKRQKDTKDTKEAKDTKDTKDTKEASPGAKLDLTGTWNLSVELPNLTATPTLVLKQDGEKLTGDYVSAQYGKFPISGTVKGADVTVSFSMNIEGSAINVTYTGKAEKDSLKGSVAYGDMMSGTFSAVRKQ
jgi:hypothetical protein